MWRRTTERKQTGAIRIAAVLLFQAVFGAHAGDLTLVSIDQVGAPGAAHSAFVSLEFRPPQVLDDGTVFFLSFAALEPALDANSVVDLYRRSEAATDVVDLPNLALGNCFRAAVDRQGDSAYLVRQFGNPTQFELLSGPVDGKISFGIRFAIGGLDRAAAAAVTAYDTAASGRRHIVLHDLTPTPPVEIPLTAAYTGDSGDPALSADGTRLVFASTAWDLVVPDTNQRQDVFLYETDADRFTLVSQRLDNIDNEDAEQPAISGNGEVIAFVSADSSMTAADRNGCQDVFTAVAGHIERQSLADAGTEADADSDSPRLNDDGRFLVFVSAATLNDGVGSGGMRQVYLRDRDSDRTVCLSVNSGGQAATADCQAPAISPSGRYVSFVSRAANLAVGADGSYHQVFRVDRGPDYANHPPTLAGAYLSGPVDTHIAFTPAIADADADSLQVSIVGSPAVTFLEDKAGAALLPGQAYGPETFPWRIVVPPGSGVFHDTFRLQATDGKAESRPAEIQVQTLLPAFGFIRRASLDAAGAEAAADSYVLGNRGLGISGAGSSVVFSSRAALTPEDDDGGFVDVYLRDLVQASTHLISAGTGAARNAYLCVLSGDGSAVAYYTQDGRNLLLTDVDTGAETVVAQSMTADPVRPPALSWYGDRVLYERDGVIRLYDAGSETTHEVSVNTAGVPADAACAEPALSGDGRVAAFRSAATNLGPVAVAGVQTVYLRYMDHALTVPASLDNGGQPLLAADKPALSVTGRTVAFLAAASGDVLYVKDMAAGTCREIVAGVANPALSADGRFVCYSQGGQLYRVDLSAPVPTAVLVSNSAGSAADGTTYQGVVSASGQFTALASDATDLVTDDTNAVRDVFVSDFGPPANDLPAATLTTVADALEDTPRAGIRLTFSDADGDDVRAQIVTQPEHGAVALFGPGPGEGEARATYEPDPNYFGVDRFWYRCADAGGWSPAQEVAVTVTEVNDPPQLAAVPDQEIAEGELLQVDLQGTDPDLANPAPATDTLTYTVTPAGAGQVDAGVGGGPVYSYQPAYDVVARDGPPLDLAVTIRVEDAAAAAAEQTFSVRVHDRNDVPHLALGSVLDLDPAAADAALTTGLVQVTDDDDDAADLDIRIVAGPDRGELWHAGSILAPGDLVSYADFPLLFVAPTGSGGVTHATLQAVDATGAASAEAVLVIRFGETGLDIVLEAGWNVFSLPYTPIVTDPEQVFARPGRAGTWAVGPVWYFDGDLQVFRPARSLHPGNAYALYCTDVPAGPISVDVDPTVPVPQTLPLRHGWSFVGPVGFGPATGVVVDARQRPFTSARILECLGAVCTPSADGILRRGMAYWLYSDVAQNIEATLVPVP